MFCFFIIVKQSQEQKQKFVDAFQEFSVNHGCIKNFPVKVHLEAIIFLSLFSLLCLNNFCSCGQKSVTSLKLIIEL